MDIFNPLRVFTKEPITKQEIKWECMNVSYWMHGTRWSEVFSTMWGHSYLLLYTCNNIGQKYPQTSLGFSKQTPLNEDFVLFHIKFDPLNIPDHFQTINTKHALCVLLQKLTTFHMFFVLACVYLSAPPLPFINYKLHDQSEACWSFSIWFNPFVLQVLSYL